MKGTAITKRHMNHFAFGLIGGFTDGFGNFTSFTSAKTDTAGTVPGDNQSGEGKTTATLDHLGDAVDVNKLVDQLVIALFFLFPATTTTGAAFILFGCRCLCH
jgi:hypothetical protein